MYSRVLALGIIGTMLFMPLLKGMDTWNDEQEQKLTRFCGQYNDQVIQSQIGKWYVINQIMNLRNNDSYKTSSLTGLIRISFEFCRINKAILNAIGSLDIILTYLPFTPKEISQILHQSFMKIPLETCKILICHGAANIDQLQATHNMTALHLAALENKLEKAGKLIALGANPDARNEWNQTPLDLCTRSQISMRQLLTGQPLAH